MQMQSGAMLVTMTAEQLEEVVQRAVTRAMGKAETNSPAPSPLLTKSALSMALGCSTTTLDHMVRDGLPYVVIGRTKRFDLPKTRAWLETRKLGERTTREAEAPATPHVSLAGVRRLGRR